MKECEECKRVAAAFAEWMATDLERIRRWRDAGLSVPAIRDLVSRYEQEEISLSRLVEDLRDMAEVAVQRQLNSRSET